MRIISDYVNFNISENLRTSMKDTAIKTTYIPRIAKYVSVLSISVVVIASLVYYLLNYCCDLEDEHNEMSCQILFFIAFSPFMGALRLNLINVAHKWGLVEFNETVRSSMDSKMFNTTELFVNHYLTQFPISTKIQYIRGTKTYIYTPTELVNDNSLHPVLIYLHGGGGASGSPIYYDATMRYLSHHLQQIIIVPEYMRSPQQLFPDIEEECLRVSMHVLENGEQLGVDSNRVTIVGDSYGGHLALYIVTKWNELNTNKIHNSFRSISLIYPSIQWYNIQLQSFRNPRNQYKILTTELYAIYCSLGISGTLDLVPFVMNSTLPLLSKDYKSRLEEYPQLFPLVNWVPTPALIEKYSLYADKVLSPYATFLFHKDLSFLPPTLIISAEYDILFTEALLFKEKLERSNVEVYHSIYEKMFHGFAFLHSPQILFSDTIKSLDETIQFIQRYL